MSPGLVLDASVAVASVLESDARRAEAIHLLRIVNQRSAIVPAVRPVEVGHALMKRVQQRALTASEADRALRGLFTLPITVVGESRDSILSAAWPLALRHRIGLYDASYVALALQTGLPLATFDRPMRGVAEAERIPLLD